MSKRSKKRARKIRKIVYWTCVVGLVLVILVCLGLIAHKVITDVLSNKQYEELGELKSSASTDFTRPPVPTDPTGETETQPSLWDGATYKENTTLGEGQYTLAITMEMEDKSILLTIKTNADNVKDALLEVGLIDGEQQAIGYLMSTLNGVRADYEKDGAYWLFCQNGEALMYGIDSAAITGDVSYEFVYTPA
jgi:hypothetical protein